jgi:hypothetical protein
VLCLSALALTWHARHRTPANCRFGCFGRLVAPVFQALLVSLYCIAGAELHDAHPDTLLGKSGVRMLHAVCGFTGQAGVGQVCAISPGRSMNRRDHEAPVDDSEALTACLPGPLFDYASAGQRPAFC